MVQQKKRMEIAFHKFNEQKLWMKEEKKPTQRTSWAEN